MASDRHSARSGLASIGEPVPIVRSAQKGVFCKEGEYWTVGYSGNAFRLKDTRGLGYLAHLLRHPTLEFHVLDLFGGIANQREKDASSQSVHGLPRGAEDLEKAGVWEPKTRSQPYGTAEPSTNSAAVWALNSG